MLRPDIRAKHARANHCSVKHELGRMGPDSSECMKLHHPPFFGQILKMIVDFE